MTADDQQPGDIPKSKNRPDWSGWCGMVFPLFGGALLVPWGADWPYLLFLVPLWAIGGVMAFGAGAAFAYFAYAYTSRSPMVDFDDLRWPVRRDGSPMARALFRTAFILGLIVAPWVAGHPVLASMYLLIQFMMVGLPGPISVDSKRPPEKPRLLGKAVFWTLVNFWRVVGWCLLPIVRVILMPFRWAVGLIGASYRRWSHRRLARRLRSTFDVPAGAVYFIYSEQHQFDRFLGPGGVLQAAISGVIARNWRDDIQPGLSVRSKTPISEDERALLRQFRISNMRKHLPFAVVIASDDRLHAFAMSEPYRKRLRDGAAALRDVENRLRLFVTVAD